jgi:hypothetical protein
MTSVKNIYGQDIDYDAAVELMDDDLRESLHNSGNFADDPQGFLEEYAKRHEVKFLEKFAPYAGGAW